jgi:hypothetical protein
MSRDVRTKKEYEEYCAAVEEFFKTEGITNLSGGHLTCQNCGFDDEEVDGHTVNFTDEEKCIKCGASREMMDEPYFSWRSCECCGGMLGGNREHATGYNPTTKEIQEYEVCSNCIYFAEYGKLDDMTMMEIGEHDDEEE